MLGRWRTELRSLAPAGFSAIEHAQTGKGLDPMQLHLYHLPELREGVVPRPPGALSRILKLVRIIVGRERQEPTRRRKPFMAAQGLLGLPLSHFMPSPADLRAELGQMGVLWSR